MASRSRTMRSSLSNPIGKLCRSIGHPIRSSTPISIVSGQASIGRERLPEARLPSAASRRRPERRERQERNGKRKSESIMKEPSESATKAWVLALTGVASSMVALDALVVATALTAIRRDFSASIEALEWTVNAYYLSFAVLMLIGAALGDLYGRRRLFVIGLGLLVAASAACALVRSVGPLIAARAGPGAGAAPVMPPAIALLSAAFPREERGKAVGIFSGLTGLALISGPVVGGAVAEGIAWPWIFWINIPIGLVAIP